MREKPMSNLDVNEIARSVQQRTLHVEVVSEVVHGRGRDSAEEKRDEVAGRVIPADAAMNDVMNLQAVRVVAQRAAVAITGVYGLSCLVRDGCG